MVALITGASSGIGRDLARQLAKKNYDLIIVARSEDKLNELKNEISNSYNVMVDVVVADLSDEKKCIKLHNSIFKNYGTIDILINNAGFGDCGNFTDTHLDKELLMIKTNITAYHILTKLFLKDMVKEDRGYILNVASIAGFMPGPLMATYYSTKAYVVRLTQSIRTELGKQKSKVKVAVLCPGPVDTNFNNVADVKFSIKGQSSEYVAKYTVKKINKKRTIIFSSFWVFLYRHICKLIPDQLASFINYNVQNRKIQ
ncbi:MAG: SDR family oxidoreductase [Clostridia bacterium]|nr:SDR family oxidoreductase [Clostridia bacterium]